jgi:hypothetical protein
MILNRIVSVAGLALAAAMFFAARGFPGRAAPAARWVFFLSGSLGFLSILLFAQSYYTVARDQIKWVDAPVFFLATAGGMVVYILVLPYAGFFIASFLFMIVLGYVLGFRKPLSLLGGTVGLLLFIYLVFVRFLAVPVPVGLLGV